MKNKDGEEQSDEQRLDTVRNKNIERKDFEIEKEQGER